MNITQITSAALATIVFAFAAPATNADTLQGGVSKTKTHHTATTQSGGTYLQRHPKVKGAAIGATAGAGVGAVAGLVTGKGMMRGAAIGAGAGTGEGLLQTSKTMKAHPFVKDAAEGTLAGAALGMAVHKGHGTGKTAMKAGALGGALGLGAGFLTKELRK